MGRITPLDPDVEVPSTLDADARRDYLPTIHERLAELATRWQYESAGFVEVKSYQRAAYVWMLEHANYWLKDISEKMTTIHDNSYNEDVYTELLRVVGAGFTLVQNRQNAALNTPQQLYGATMERLTKELEALVADISSGD